MKRRYTLYVTRYLLVLLFLISACTIISHRAEEKKVAPDEKKALSEEKKLSPEEQQKMAFAIFNKILNLTLAAEVEDERMAILPQLETLYEEIIVNYPQASIVEECYWRLATVLVNEFNPPKVDKADELYQDFLRKYPDSRMKIDIGKIIGEFYYTNKMWDKILKLFAPHIKKFIQTGKLENPYYMFMYSEAKFNLGDLIEAEKGYKIVIEFFPQSGEAGTSKKRSEEIDNIKKTKSGGV